MTRKLWWRKLRAAEKKSEKWYGGEMKVTKIGGNRGRIIFNKCNLLKKRTLKSKTKE